MNTATQLLEQALEALVESRDDVATAIHLVPSYKADLERRVAEATKQLDKHETAIKDIEAYLAKQQVEQEPIGTVRTCVWNGNGFTISATVNTKLRFNQALYTSPQAREQVEQEPIGTVRQANGCTYVEWNHVPPEAGTVCYSTPQAREPMTDEQIGDVCDVDLDVMSTLRFARAIEAHHGIK